MKYHLLLCTLFFGLLLHGNEAAQYFKEYQELLKSREIRAAAGKIAAAVALEPNNETYRYNDLTVRARLFETMSWTDRVAALNEQFDRVAEFAREFPASKQPMYSNPFSSGSFINQLSRSITKPEMQAMAKFCEKWRPLVKEEQRRLWFNYDLSDGINSVNELQSYSLVIKRSNTCDLYFDYAAWLKGRYREELEFLRYAHDFVRKNPNQLAAAAKKIDWQGIHRIEFPNYPFNDYDQVIIDYVNGTDEYLKMAENSPFEEVKIQAAHLKMMRKAVNAPRNKETFVKFIDEFFRELDEINPKLNAPSDSPNSNFMQSRVDMYFCQWWVHERGLAEFELKKYRQKTNKTSTWDSLRRLFDARDYDALLKRVPEIQQFNHERMCKNSVANSFISPVENLFPRNQEVRSPAQIRLFNEINNAFEIETLDWQKLFNHPGYLRCVEMTEHNGDLYLMLRDVPVDRPATELLLGIWRKDGSVSAPVKTPIMGDYYMRGNWFMLRARRLAVSDEWIVYSMSSTLAVYDRAKSSWHFIEDFLDSPPLYTAIVQGRIYTLCGAEVGPPADISLSSAKMDGSDRRVHFNTTRSTKTNIAEQNKGIPCSLIAYNGNELWFMVAMNREIILFRYRLDRDEFMEMARFRRSSEFNFWYQADEKMMYVLADSQITRIDPADGKPHTFISFNRKAAEYRMDGLSESFRTPWLIHGGRLWGSGYNPICANLTDFAKSPMLLLPPCRLIFERDESVIYQTPSRYFKVKPKKGGQRK